MAYCTNSDVVNEFKSLNTTDGKITTTKIDTWIAQADAYINGRIGNVYTTPITGAESLLIIKEISIGLVAQRISRILDTKAISPKGDQYIPKDLIEKAEKRLDMIVNRQMVLSDATLKTTHGGVSSYTSDNTVDRTFDLTKNQW
jgi:hypothetical protein